jgi:PAS domain S-box-containing protein
MRILLADDNHFVRKVTAAELVKDGHEVLLAEDGEQALNIAQAQRPDFIISDVLMPNKDGFSLCLAVREDEHLHDTPLIFYSATFFDPEDEALAYSVGANGFIHKNGDPQQFRQRLHELLTTTIQRLPSQYDRTPVNREELQRLHAAALIRKLHSKVTELESKQRALAGHKRFLNQVLTTIPDVVFALKLPGLEPSFIAPEAERLIGFSGDDVKGNAALWLALIHDDDRLRIHQEIANAIAARTKAVCIGRMRHKHGGFRWVEARFSPRFDAHGEPIELIGSLSDVTARRKIEEQLRESERSLDNLLHNLPGMAYRCDNTPDWRLSFISEGAESLTGYGREMLLNNKQLTYADLIVPEDRDRVWDEVQKAISEKGQFSISYRIRHRDGSVRWVWERGTGVFDEADNVLCIEGFINDITLRKRAEDELIASEQRYRNLFSMMESGMSVHELVYDTSGSAIDYRFVAINSAFERLTGLKSEAIIGHTVREVLPDIEEKWIADYIHVAQSGVPARFVRYIAALKSYFDVVAYRTDEHQFVTLFTDVTEQRRAEEEIKSLARFTQENPSPVARIDTNGNVLYANPAYEEMVRLCDNRDKDGHCHNLVLVANEALQSGTIRHIDINAANRNYSFVVTPLRDSGYANLYGLEITERVQAAKQLGHLNRVLRTLSKGNRTLVHATQEEELLNQVSSVLVEEGEYPFVWLATMNDGKPLNIRFQCRQSGGDMNAWLKQFIESPRITAQIGIALKNREPLLVSGWKFENDITGDANQLDDAQFSVLLILPIVFKESHYGVIGIFYEKKDIFDPQEMELLKEMVSDVAYGIQALRTKQAHEKSMERIQKTMLQTIEAVSVTLEKRDPYTAGHQQRVSQLAVAIGQEMGLATDRIEGLRLGAMVHDIGKIYVPAEILNRPGRLSEPELGIIKSHPQVGYDILKGVDFDWPIADMVLQHHERCDGSGYPRGMVRREIVLEARILAVADVVEAITSHRPYRPGLGLEVALNEIIDKRTSYYDSDVVDTCVRLFREKKFAWEQTEPLSPVSVLPTIV